MHQLWNDLDFKVGRREAKGAEMTPKPPLSKLVIACYEEMIGEK